MLAEHVRRIVGAARQVLSERCLRPQCLSPAAIRDACSRSTCQIARAASSTISCLVHLVGLADFPAFNAVYEQKFSGVKPVRTTVRADLAAGMLVEITWSLEPRSAYFNEVEKGGHFAAWEEPEVFSSELREAFRSLR